MSFDRLLTQPFRFSKRVWPMSPPCWRSNTPPTRPSPFLRPHSSSTRQGSASRRPFPSALTLTPTTAARPVPTTRASSSPMLLSSRHPTPCRTRGLAASGWRSGRTTSATTRGAGWRAASCSTRRRAGRSGGRTARPLTRIRGQRSGVLMVSTFGLSLGSILRAS